MRTVLRKIYTLAPLAIVAFFFQNCTSDQKPYKSPYAGISNVKTAPAQDVSNQ